MTSPTRLPSLRRTPGNSRPVSMIEGPLTNIPDFSRIHAEVEPSKKANRRSLLAQLSRKAPSEGRGLSRANGVKAEQDGDISRTSDDTKRSSESSGRRALEEERTDIPSPSSKLSRPMSMIPPRASSYKTSKTRSKQQASEQETSAETDLETARAESLAALQGTAPVTASKLSTAEPGLQRSGSSKLPQAPRAGGLAIPSRTTSVRLKDVDGKKSSRTKGIQAASVIRITEEQTSPPKRRQKSVNSPPPDEASSTTLRPSQHSTTTSRSLQTSEVPQPVSPPRSSMLSRPRPTSQLIPPAAKPSFSTYQQHYSPAKSSLPKPPVPQAKQQIVKPVLPTEEDSTVSFDVTKQQIELLQLSILHQSSTRCMTEYTASARRKLGKMHSKLRKDYENLRATELIHQHTANVSALDIWCPDTGMLVENLQILSLVYSDLTSLMEEGSRHSDVVSMFELWMNEAEAPDSKTFMQPLPEGWKATHASLALKLRSIQRNLRVLPPIRSGDGSTGLEMVMKACKTLVEDMLKELEVMGKLEKEMMARENVKVEDEVNALITSDAVTKEPWVPPWQKIA